MMICYTLPQLLAATGLAVVLTALATSAVWYAAWRLGPRLDRDDDETAKGYTP